MSRGAHPEGEAVEAEVAGASASRGGDVRGLGGVRCAVRAVAGVEHAEAALVAVEDIPGGQRLGEGRVHRVAGRRPARLWLGRACGEALLRARAVEVAAVQDQVAPATSANDKPQPVDIARFTAGYTLKQSANASQLYQPYENFIDNDWGHARLKRRIRSSALATGGSCSLVDEGQAAGDAGASGALGHLEAVQRGCGCERGRLRLCNGACRLCRRLVDLVRAGPVARAVQRGHVGRLAPQRQGAVAGAGRVSRQRADRPLVPVSRLTARLRRVI